MQLKPWKVSLLFRKTIWLYAPLNRWCLPHYIALEASLQIIDNYLGRNASALEQLQFFRVVIEEVKLKPAKSIQWLKSAKNQELGNIPKGNKRKDSVKENDATVSPFKMFTELDRATYGIGYDDQCWQLFHCKCPTCRKKTDRIIALNWIWICSLLSLSSSYLMMI